MLNLAKSADRPLRIVAAACSALTMVLAAEVLLGWALHAGTLVRFGTSLPPMPAATALGLEASGLALLAFITGRSGLTVIGAAGSAILLLASTLAEPTLIAPVTAFCLQIFAAALILSHTARPARRSALMGITGVVLAATGIASSIGLLSGQADVFAWGHGARVALPGALGLLLLGTGALAVALREIDLDSREPAWLSIGAGLFVATLRTGLWDAFSAKGGPMDFLTGFTLFGALFSGLVFGVFAHLFVKACFQREALRVMNRRLEAEMLERRRAEQEANAANRAKGEFLAHMSHEIRTPINGVLGMTELVLDTDLTGDQREFLEIARSSADALLTVVNDILDFSKIEAGKLDLSPVPFRLRETVRRLIRPLSCEAEKKGVEMLCDIRPDVPDDLLADPTRLAQVITNLLGNAVKFTGAGEIELGIGIDRIAGDTALLHASVRDTGIGVPADKLADIFRPFTQADGSTTRRFGGTGLGLTVSRRLVEMMDGRIWVESEPGVGSCFHFTCAVKVLDTAAPGPPAALRGLSALLVDDNPANLRIVAGLLTSCGITPALAHNAYEALAQHGAYPLTILDSCMPEMDGFALLEKMRERGTAAGAVVMLVSPSAAAEAARCRGLGIAHVSKPVCPDRLIAAMAEALDRVPAPRATAPPGPAPEDQPLRVLLVEDNAVNRKLAHRVLQKHGHAVTAVTTGRAALRALEDEAFDIVLMDVQMPEMDGLETTFAIRENEKRTGAHIPIVAMTAHAMNGDRERCLAAGMDGYASKPIRPQELLQEMRRVHTADLHATLAATC